MINLKMFLLLLISLIFNNCEGQSTINKQALQQSEKQVIIQDTFPRFHTYGGHELKHTGNGYYSFQDDSPNAKFLIEEIYPGILLYEHLPSNTQQQNYFKIEFYNPKDKILLNTIDLNATSAYTSKSLKNLDLGCFNPEEMYYAEKRENREMSDCHNCEYLSNNLPVKVTSDGVVILKNFVFKATLEGKVINYEETLFGLNKYGQYVFKISSPVEIYGVHLSADHKFLAYLYGGNGMCYSGDAPFASLNCGITILDLTSKRSIFEYSVENLQTCLRIKEHRNVLFLDKVVNMDRKFERKEIWMVNFAKMEILKYDFMQLYEISPTNISDIIRKLESGAITADHDIVKF